MAEKFALGIDLGGTKMEGIVLRRGESWETPAEEGGDAQVDARIRRPTGAEGGYECIVDGLLTLIRDLQRSLPGTRPEDLRIGVGLPGGLSRRTGLVKNSNTICLNGRDLWGDVRRALQRPVAFENDANCMTLAEAVWGAGQGGRLVFGIILGTGVGGGLVFDRQLWAGRQNIAGEWGHTILESAGPPCYCGRRGCVETFLSGPALEQEFRQATGLDWTTPHFSEALHGTSPPDAPLRAAWNRYLERFGRATAGVINVLDPDIIVIAGGLSLMPSLCTEAPRTIAPWIFNDEVLTRIVPASLGDSSGVFGAALIAS